MRIKGYFIFFICIIGSWRSSAKELDYSVHANIIYRFTKYIDWPEQMKSGNFVIGIVGETSLYDELLALTRNKNVKGQSIAVKYLSPDAASFNAHIVFVSEEESRHLRKIVEVTAEKPVLIVSERSGLISKGSCINLIIIGDHLKLEFGKTNIERRNLKIASELLKLGTIVN